MIDGISSYAVGDFIPFVDEVYYRLFERQFEAWWPVHLLLLASGVIALAFACMGKNRIVAVLLGFLLLVCSVTFHFRLYAELTPVGSIFGWAFLVQIPLVLAWGFMTKFHQSFRPDFPTIAGAAIAMFGLAVYPLLAFATERSGLGAAEYLGMAPDPTVCFIMGILLMSARSYWFLLLFPIPLLWSATTGATLNALDAPLPMTLPVLAAVALSTSIYKAVLRKSPGSPGGEQSACPIG